ncbi:MAG TPA: methylenetetrahydrofolate--tRNA-(uracil(54)-C(5))-methyltransferase (FADH(2)-oxidizing) TrmFO [Thermoanaerobaculia bacterium]|jgi:methylenetetrahydrofolate--tRNA-(uracil-5-)-methyltransferase|nr:methylenetetrahydrofolate--tRNA-(uracil(54)-C(5))-methyltransferase (FADH(2)-oxidizing) TrmFO [Thermoanaerobaculia bacterium]
MPSSVYVIGGGLAGSECAWQLAERGVPVVLHEMRPVKGTPAHKTGDLAELVCSNSLRSDDPFHAAGLLKREMEAFGSLIIGSARKAAVPAGSALALDRDRFAALVTEAIARHPRIELRRGEVMEIPEGEVVIATGPLTSEAMSAGLQRLLGSEYLYFYDAIAPIVEAESLDLSKLFWQSRYGKGEGEDYLNAPMNKEEYLAFHQAIAEAEVVAPHEFEKAVFFEGCLPIEELARRGVDTLRYGPMKPVGLTAPDGRRPYAVVQLRQENLAKSHFNLVGFQSRMKWGEQERVLRMIPGLANARFVRFGQIHRNTFINAPIHLDKHYRVKAEPRVRLAGQITGVEGYLESAATGLAIGLYMALERQGCQPEPFPATTALGALARHLTESDPRHFQPANINYGLFAELPERVRQGDRRAAYVERAQAGLAAWAERNRVEAAVAAPCAG